MYACNAVVFAYVSEHMKCKVAKPYGRLFG